MLLLLDRRADASITAPAALLTLAATAPTLTITQTPRNIDATAAVMILDSVAPVIAGSVESPAPLVLVARIGGGLVLVPKT